MEDYTSLTPAAGQHRQFHRDGLKGGLLKLDTVDIADMTVRVHRLHRLVTSVQT